MKSGDERWAVKLPDDLLTWLRLHWRQDGVRTKWINKCEGEVWPEK